MSRFSGSIDIRKGAYERCVSYLMQRQEGLLAVESDVAGFLESYLRQNSVSLLNSYAQMIFLLLYAHGIDLVTGDENPLSMLDTSILVLNENRYVT